MPHRLGPFLVALLTLATAAPAQELAPALDVRLFGDFNYVTDDEFRQGQLVGHLAAELSERLTFFTELSVTVGRGAEAERAVVRYDFGDYLKLSAGRVHTPVSYWNTAYHHGQWLQTTVARPKLVAFGSTLLPIHMTGVFAEGAVPTPGPVSLGYVLGMGNGGRHVHSPHGAGHRGAVVPAAGTSAALVAQGFLRVPALTGFQVGGAFYTDRLAADPALQVEERIVSSYLAWERTAEVLLEYARITHEPRGGGEIAHSHGMYGQLGYRLPGRADRWKPYLRYERIDADEGDPLLAPLRLGYEGAILGIRYDPAPMAALKLEYRQESVEGEARSNALAAQLSFTVGIARRAHAEPVTDVSIEEDPDEPAR